MPPQLCVALQGGCPACSAITSERMCIFVCVHSLMSACFCHISGSYCCCSLSWEVGLMTFLLGSLELSRNEYVPTHMKFSPSPLFFPFTIRRSTIPFFTASCVPLHQFMSMYSHIYVSINQYVFVFIVFFPSVNA